MRIRTPWIGLLFTLLVPATPAFAASQSVTATSAETFTPAAVSVFAGESVTWTNSGGSHNVHFQDGSFTQPMNPESPPWTVSRTFTTLGTFNYACDAHPSMTGTVTVQAPGAGGPGGQPAQPVGADKVAPAVKVSGAGGQRVLRRRAVVVVAEVDESASVVARGTVTVPGAAKAIRLRKVSRKLAAGARATLRLKLGKQAVRALRKAFARRARLTARITVSATDSAGNKRSAKSKVRLRA